eukprot:172270-Hanusia_phi.AAC.1
MIDVEPLTPQDPLVYRGVSCAPPVQSLNNTSLARFRKASLSCLRARARIDLYVHPVLAKTTLTNKLPCPPRRPAKLPGPGAGGRGPG